VESGPDPRESRRRSVRRRPADVDAAARARWIQLLVWGGLPGGLIGFIAGSWVGGLAGGVVGALLVGAAAVGFGAAIAEAAGRLFARIHHPSGASTPSAPDLSRADSLAARGRWDEALTAYREAMAERPGDPTPYLRIARLLRDELGRHEEAAHWFRRVRREVELGESLEVLVGRELVEIYRNRLGEPLRAAPELARLVERFGDAPVADWARRELRDVKAEVARRRRD